ncbi:MAG: branched-chain amino acid ABC transporter permease [Actinomycetota bacterium]
MGNLVSVVMSGLALGSISALVALGFIVTFKATGIINFAQGGLVTLGAYLGYITEVQLGLPPYFAFPIVLVFMFGVGVLLERIVHAPLRGRPSLVVVIATLGVGLVIQAILLDIYGTNARSVPALAAGAVVHILGANIAVYDLIIIGVTAVAIAALMLVFGKTQLGRQFRATSLDPAVASLQGIPVKRFAIIAFGAGGLLAGLAGLMVAPRSPIDTNIGFTAMITAFAAAVIGGFGRLEGVVAGALALGLISQLGGAYIAYQYQELYPFVVMIIVIAIRPNGLLGSQSRVRL